MHHLRRCPDRVRRGSNLQAGSRRSGTRWRRSETDAARSSLAYIAAAKREGARLLCGGNRPSDPRLAAGFFVEPTVFADVQPTMRIAREEIFGPVLAVLPWSDESDMLDAVNGVDYGLTCSIWTNDPSTAHRTAMAVQAGYVWINEVGKHFLGAPFGGVKQSGFGREECLEEMLRFTQERTYHVKLRNGQAVTAWQRAGSRRN